MSKENILTERNVKKYDKKYKKYNESYNAFLGKLSKEERLTIFLFKFGMGRQITDNKKGKFKEELADKISRVEKSLEQLKTKRLDNFSSKDEEHIKKIYNEFSDGYKSINKRFDVGATKIMHFLQPNLFIMIDSNVRKGLARNKLNCPKPQDRKKLDENYVKIMKIYQDKINESRNLRMKNKYKKSLPRILDKCFFVVGGDVNHKKN